jgi:hypothetical protein
MKKRAWIIFSIGLLLSACLDEIKLPAINRSERLVVEGGITDSQDKFFLRLSYTDGVGAPRRVLPTSGVYVEIQGSDNKKYVLRADPLGTGFFSPESGSLIGKAGISYNIYIKLSTGQEYKSSPQLMPNLVEISTLKYEAKETPQSGYAISADLVDPANTANFYRWKAEGFSIRRATGVVTGFGDNRCCTTCWVKNTDESINVLSDQNFNGNTIKNHPVYFSKYYGLGAHKIRISQYNISKEAFQYYKKLGLQLSRSGSIFDPLPATVKGNIVNVSNSDDTALGFFEVASVNKKEITVLEESLKKFDQFYSSPSYVPEGDCQLRYPFSLYFESYNQTLF